MSTRRQSAVLLSLLCFTLPVTTAWAQDRQPAAKPGEKEPVKQTGAHEAAAQLEPIYDESADAKSQIAGAVATAKRSNQRVLLMFGANWCPWCHKLNTLFKTDKTVAHELQYEYKLVLVDVCGPNGKGIGHNLDLAQSYGADLKKNGIPYLCVLDGDGKPLTTQDTGALEDGDHHSTPKVMDFLKKFEATPIDAEKALAAGLTEARKTGKPAFVRMTAPWCVWCRRLEAVLYGPEIGPLFESAVVSVEIDQDRMPHAADVEQRLRKNVKGGIPWFAFVDGDGKTLGVSEVDGQNIGFPTEPKEIDHIVGLLKTHAKRLSADQLDKIRKALSDAADKINSQRKTAEHG